jgi:hypothetical protein
MAAVAPAVALAVLWRGWRRPGHGFLDVWQSRFDVEVPDDERAFVTTRLLRGRRIRAAGVAVGVGVAGVPSYMNLIDPSRAADFANPLVGNAWMFGATVGGLLAEALVVQRPRVRRATLEVRRARDYTDRRFVIAVYAAVPLTLVLASISTILGGHRWWFSWFGVAGAGVAAAGVALGLRAIVDRPALAPEGIARDVDDALRADGALRLVGTAVALAAMGVSTSLPHGAPGGWSFVHVVFGYVSLLGLVWWWSLARDVRWSVPRARALT